MSKRHRPSRSRRTSVRHKTRDTHRRSKASKHSQNQKLFMSILLVIALISIILVVADKYKVTNSVMYPVKYEKEIEEVAEKYGVDPYLVLAVIKVESGWREKAESPAGAQGLMQVMPSTAKYMIDANIVDTKEVSEEDLLKPLTNIEFGTAYLGYVLNRFGDLEVALAAYNAGPTRAQKWLDEGGDFSEAVDINETANYLELVRKAKQGYEERYPHIF